MKSNKIISLWVLLVIGALASSAFMNAKILKKVNAGNKGFAVIELYTSEGCSSCPPADAVVAKIEKESKDQPVYILAYHVDYWNSLGWKDAFSSSDFSKRQRDYASYLHLQSVYTPQIVVNGKTEFVGSEEGTLRNAIKTNLVKTAAATLTLNVSSVDQSQATIKYDTRGADKNEALFIAIVQKNAQTRVERGENGGRTLSHVQIVRKLQKVAINGDSGEVKVSLPKGFDSQSWEIVGFLQDTANGTINGASKAEFTADVKIASVKNSK